MAESCESAATARSQIHTIAILQLAERQWGVITRAQLDRAGVTSSTITRWVTSGRLQRVYPRVYVVGHLALRTEGRLLAALLYAGPGAALSHGSAASWWELVSYEPRLIHVCSPVQRRSVPGVHVHRARRLDRVRHRGLPVTTVARTLLDFASVSSFDRLRRAVAEAEFRRLLDLEEIDAVLGRGRPGSAALGQALERHRPEYARTMSPLEGRLLDLCQGHGIPLPAVNVRIAGYKVDALWRDHRVVAEVDGGAAHGTAARMEADRDRDLALRAAVYVVVRYTWRQVTGHAASVAADLRRVLGL